VIAGNEGKVCLLRKGGQGLPLGKVKGRSRREANKKSTKNERENEKKVVVEKVRVGFVWNGPYFNSLLRPSGYARAAVTDDLFRPSLLPSSSRFDFSSWPIHNSLTLPFTFSLSSFSRKFSFDIAFQ
jgi:hypothetical protein